MKFFRYLALSLMLPLFASAASDDAASRFYFAIGGGPAWGGPGDRAHEAIGGAFGLHFGYGRMFNNYLGVRPYVNIDGRAGITGISANGIDQNQGNTNARVFGSASLGFNVDMLANFYVNESRTFHAGGILGVGVGGGYGGFAAAESDGAAQRANAEGSYGTFGHFHLNVGLKATWNRKHGLEVLARIPLAAWGSGERVQGNLDSAGNSQSSYSNNRPYSNGTAIFVMYAYSI